MVKRKTSAKGKGAYGMGPAKEGTPGKKGYPGVFGAMPGGGRKAAQESMSGKVTKGANMSLFSGKGKSKKRTTTNKGYNDMKKKIANSFK